MNNFLELLQPADDILFHGATDPGPMACYTKLKTDLLFLSQLNVYLSSVNPTITGGKWTLPELTKQNILTNLSYNY